MSPSDVHIIAYTKAFNAKKTRAVVLFVTLQTNFFLRNLRFLKDQAAKRKLLFVVWLFVRTISLRTHFGFQYYYISQIVQPFLLE